MKKIIVKSLFCPNKEYLQINLDTFVKLDMYMKLYGIDMDMLLIGWNNNYNINEFLKLYPITITTIKKIYWPYNYGKYKLFNELKVFLKNENYDYVIYLDHDCYFDFNNKIDFDKITTLCDTHLIVFNQLLDIRHQSDIYENKSIINDIKIIWPNVIGSIACGAFITSTNNFMKLDDFDLVSIYGLDDISLIMAMLKIGYRTVVLEQCYIVHPYHKNESYDNWKYETIMMLSFRKKINYYEQIEQFHNLFN